MVESVLSKAAVYFPVNESRYERRVAMNQISLLFSWHPNIANAHVDRDTSPRVAWCQG